MPSLSEILHGKYMEDEEGYQIDAGDGGGLVGALNRKHKAQVDDPSQESLKRYTEWEAGAPSGPPYAWGAPPRSEQCAGLGYGGFYVPGYNEYIGYSEAKDCSEYDCWGGGLSYTGSKVCVKRGVWSGGRCARLDQLHEEIAEYRKGFYEGTLKPFYRDEYSVGGFTKYAYNPFPLANQEAERRLLYGKEIIGADNAPDPGIDQSCQSIMEGTIKRLIEGAYIAGYLKVAPMVIKDIVDTYAFYAQRFIDTFVPYNPPPPPPPDGLS